MYPIVPGRVTFNNAKSYMKAVTAAFIEIKTPRFSKKVQVDPYLEDTPCSTCGNKQGPYFCRDVSCYKYFCRFCWELRHTFLGLQHKPLVRHIRGFNRERFDIGSPLGVCPSTPPRRPRHSPSRGMATPSREPGVTGERALSSSEAFLGGGKVAGFARSYYNICAQTEGGFEVLLTKY